MTTITNQLGLGTAGRWNYRGKRRYSSRISKVWTKGFICGSAVYAVTTLAFQVVVSYF